MNACAIIHKSQQETAKALDLSADPSPESLQILLTVNNQPVGYLFLVRSSHSLAFHNLASSPPCGPSFQNKCRQPQWNAIRLTRQNKKPPTEERIFFCLSLRWSVPLLLTFHPEGRVLKGVSVSLCGDWSFNSPTGYTVNAVTVCGEKPCRSTDRQSYLTLVRLIKDSDTYLTHLGC